MEAGKDRLTRDITRDAIKGEVQEIMRLLREQDYNIPLQFTNMKS